MKKIVGFTILAASILFSATAFASENVLLPDMQAPQQLIPYGAVSKDGYFKGIRLAGQVKVVKNFPDFTIQYVDNFPDIKIQFVDNFPGVP